MIKLRTRKGMFEAKVDYALGSVQNPMDFNALEEKLMDCAFLSAKPVSDVNLETLVQMVRNLEDVKEVSNILSLIV